MSEVSTILPAGVTLQGGKYRIIKTLGQGGFGITYLAEQTGLGMKVAIKEFFLKSYCQRDSSTSRVQVPVTDNKELVSRCLKKFKSEARKIASLNNDHIVSTIDIFDENETSYYVIKYLEGGSLADRIKQKPLTEAQALAIIREVADALRTIHANKLLHLDIKPANILFDDRGRAVLIDFGVSKYVDSQSDSTTTSSLVGFSRGFAPLEQVNARVTMLSPATDIYSLGATLYNLVVGTTPPDASTVMDMGLPPFPAGVSEQVRFAIEQAMQPKRKDRPQDIDTFMDLFPEEPVPTRDEETVIPIQTAVPQAKEVVEAPVSPKSRNYLIAAIAFFAGALILSGFTFFSSGHKDSQSPDSARVVRLEKQIDSLKTTNGDLQKQVSSMRGQVSGSSQNTANLQKQLEDLRSRNQTQATQITNLQRENKSLKDQVDSYKPDAERWRRYVEVNR